MRTTIAVLCILTLTQVARAQSTSQPILVKPETADCSPSQGSCYLDITFKGGSIYQHANWYTHFISRNRQGDLTITVAAQFPGSTSISDTKASDPVSLSSNGTDVSLSYEGPIVSMLPLTFSQVSFDVQINQAAKDGLNTLLTLFARQSAITTPISAATIGYISAGKAIADFLFNPQLTKSRAVGQFSFTPTTAPAPGYYAVLAGEDTPAWEHLASNITLLPDGQLSSASGDISHITYYVYEVTYRKRRYATLDAALSDSASQPWAKLYLGAIISAGNGWTLDQYGSIESNLRKQLEDAQTLLVSDVDLTADEKFALIKDATDAANRAYAKRYLALVKARQAPKIRVGGKLVPTVPPNLLAFRVGGTIVPTEPNLLMTVHDAIADAIRQLAIAKVAVSGGHE